MSSAIRSPAADSAFWRRRAGHPLHRRGRSERTELCRDARRFHVRKIERRSLLLSWPDGQPGKPAIPLQAAGKTWKGYYQGIVLILQPDFVIFMLAWLLRV